MRITRIYVFAIALMVICAFRLALACSCMPIPQSVEQAQGSLSRASAVFLGKVVDTEPIDRVANELGSLRYGWATIEIVDAIKGVDNATPEKIFVDSRSCGSGLRAGNTYFLLTYRSEPNAPLTEGGCGNYLYESPRETDLEKARFRKSALNTIMSYYRRAVE